MNTHGLTSTAICSSCVLALALGTPADAAGQDSDRPAAGLSATRVPADLEVRLDGLLDEGLWSQVAPASGFRQREPDEGAPATERTEVRVLHDGENLYIGVLAFDSRPDRIIGRQLARDAELSDEGGGDDAVEIILDTFHDRRNAYYFATNPRGVQVDGLFVDESREADLDWDAVWEVRSTVTRDGWSAELRIPLQTLRYPQREGAQTWGFNVQRTIARKNEQSLWRAWSRDNEGLNRISRAGELGGLELDARGVDLMLKPYTLGQVGRDFRGDATGTASLDGDLGLDAKLGFASGLILDLTVNTDFAQVEADDDQVDLTRFELFFPEKREFFLENAGIFEFGSGGGFGPPDLLLFFSRRIGLSRTAFAEARPVPILGGARLTGRAGRQTIGVLNVVTDDEPAVGSPMTNFAVARVKRDIGRRSYVGAIVTHRLEEGGFENLAGGADLNLWLSDPLVLEAYYARTSQSGPGGEGAAWDVSLDYTGDWFGWRVGHMEVGNELNPGIGFVRRDDIANSSGGFRLSPRPPIPGLRVIDIFNRFEYVAAAGTREVRDRSWEISVSPELHSGDEARFELERRFQRLTDPFELTPGVMVPAGDYSDWRFRADLSSSRNRPISGELEAGTEGFWDGTRWQLGGSVAFTSPHIGVELGLEHNDVEVPGGAFTADLVQARINLALDTRLFGNTLIQYNSQTGAFSTNFRVDFIHRPGSDLFIVFNERRDVLDGRWEPVSESFIVKLTYLRWF